MSNLATVIITELRMLKRLADARGKRIAELELETEQYDQMREAYMSTAEAWVAEARRDRWWMLAIGVVLGVWATFMFFAIAGWWR